MEAKADSAADLACPSFLRAVLQEGNVFLLTRRQLLGVVARTAATALVPAVWTSPTPVVEEGFVPIGGIDQWVAMRGRDRSRTALLFLHGGPCEAQSPFLSLFAPWEKRYVVAQWDQRGSGRTFGKNGTSTPNMTLEQLAHDAVEVTQYVLGRLKAHKLILVGHSWGAVLGLSVVRLRPALFHAFVGTGQPVSGRAIIEGMRSSAVTRAQGAGDVEAVAALKGLSDADLADMSKLNILFKWVAPFPAPDLDFLIRRGALLGPPDRPASIAAADFLASNPDPRDPASHPVCLLKLWRFAFEFDAAAAGYDLPVPFFVIQGRNDSRTPPEAARAFVNQVHAPAKGYTAIDGGHFACFDNPTGFLNALDTDMRTLGINLAFDR
jgi:proline iminopeptidase